MNHEATPIAAVILCGIALYAVWRRSAKVPRPPVEDSNLRATTADQVTFTSGTPVGTAPPHPPHPPPNEVYFI